MNKPLTPNANSTILVLVENHHEIEPILGDDYTLIHVISADALQAALLTPQARLVILDDANVCEQIRTTTALPILMLIEDADVDSAMVAGADDCMRLPLQPDLLKLRVQCLLQFNTFFAYDNLPIMVHAIGQDLRIKYVNDFWLESLGYTRDEVLGESITDFMDETSRIVFHLIIDDLWTTHRLEDIRHRMLSKKRNGIDVLLTTETVTQRTGEIIGLTVARNISDLTQIEESLLTSEQQTQSILTAMTDTVFVMDADGYYVRVLTSRMSSMNIQSEALEGKNVYDTGSRKRADLIWGAIQETLANDKPTKLEYDVIHDDEKHWFLATFSPISNTNQVVVAVREITDQKSVEQSLRESEQRYRNLFESANDGILIINIQTAQVMQGNAQIARMLKYSVDDLKGMHINDIEQPLDITDEDSGNLGATNQLITESQYIQHDGAIIPVETSNRIIKYENQPALLVFVRDISERKQAYEAEQQQRELAEALRDTAAAFNRTLSFDEVLDTLLANVTKVVPHDTANIMLLDGDVCRIVRIQGYDKLGYHDEDVLGFEIDWRQAQNLRLAVETRRPIVIYDTQATDIDWVDTLANAPVLSIVTAPMVLEDKVVGFINLDSRDTDNFSLAEAQRLEAFANQATIAFQNARLFEAVQNHANDLEKRVEERTSALLNANKQLKEQIMQRRDIEEQLEQEQQLLKTLIQTIPDAIYIKDRESRFVLANAATLQNLEVLPSTTLYGKSDFDFMSADRAQDYFNEEQHIMKTGVPIINHEDSFVRDDGTILYRLITKLPLRNSQGDITGIIGVNHDITELQEAQAQLNKVLTSARCLLWYATVENTPDGYVWQIAIANEQAAQNFLPLDTSEKTYSEAWQKAIVETDKKKRQYVLETHLRFDQERYSQEFRCRLADKSVRWLMEDVHINQLDSNRWHLVGVVTDITERKTAEKNTQEILQQLEIRVQERTKNLQRTNNDLIAEIGERRRAQEQERQQRIFAEALHQSVSTLNTTLDRDTVFDKLLEVLSSIVPHDASTIMLLNDFELEVIRGRNHDDSVEGRTYDIRNMENIWLAYQRREPYIINDVSGFKGWQDTELARWIKSNISTPITLGDEIIGFLNVDSVYKDNFTSEHAERLKSFAIQAGNAIRNARMLDEIRAHALDLELRVETRTAELQSERAQLQAILDSMRDGLAYQDTEQNTLYINQAMTDITGYTLEEWQSGTAQQTMNTEPDEERQQLWRKIERTLALQGYWEGETIIVRRDSTEIDVLLVRTEVRGDDGRMGIVTVLRDISQAKQLEAQKARFIASASHELRTPIANMKTRLFLLRRQPEKMEQHLAVIDSVVDLMQVLVETMFDISRFERGVIELQSEEFVIQQIINNVYLYNEGEADRRDIKLVTDMPSTPLIIYADPYRLTQVLTNLVKNALNYTPNGGTIETSIIIDDDLITLKVSDTGEGIPQENIPHLFKPFFRGHEDNLGAGLGLSISSEIVEHLGGTISVESEIGVGSTFIIRLPSSLIRSQAIEPS